MTDNHMVFFAEIAFIYGGNDSMEKDVFGSEKSSEFAWQSVKAKRGNIHSVGNKRKTYILRFKFDFCEAVVKTRLKHS